MDVLGRYFVVVLAVILIILFPLQYIAQLQAKTIDDVVNQYSSEFTETARKEGHITKDLYEDYIHKLDATGESYDIEIEVAHPVSGKEMGKASIGDRMPELQIDQVSHQSELSDGKIYSLATHTHTDDCYSLCSGIDYNGDGVIDYRDCNEVYEGGAYAGESRFYCRICGAMIFRGGGSYYGDSWAYYYEHKVDTTNPQCSRVVTSITASQPIQIINMGGSIDTTAIATYLDGHTQTVSCSASDFDTNSVGTKTVTLTYAGLVGNAKTTGTRTCTLQVTVRNPKQLTNITVQPNAQWIQRYTNPNFTVIAYYTDHSSGYVYDYVLNGFNNTILGTQTVTISYTNEGITKTATASVTVNKLLTMCSKCSNMYELDENDTDNGCPTCKGKLVGIEASPSVLTVTKGDSLPITVQGTYANGYKQTLTGWSSNYDPNITGRQEVIISYQGFTSYITVYVTNSTKSCLVCGTIYHLEDDGSDGGCPDCRTTIDRISVSPQRVIINKHEPMPITVTALYKDGHEEIVTDWTTELVADTAGVFDVTIYYKDATANLTVEVVDEDVITCPICGLNYQFSESPDGCPVCYHTVTGIEAELRNGGTKTQYKSSLSLQIILKFKDGHKELTYTGWTVDGYQSEILGEQTVTIHYGEHTTPLTIEVVNSLPEVICPNGHTYYLDEDGSDPGCPICEDSSDRSSAVFYFDITYTSVVIDDIYEDGHYTFNEGDYLTVRVKPRKKSPIHNITNMFRWFSFMVIEEEYTFGGEVIL